MATYSFAVPKFHITEVRSAHTDTLFASTSLIVMNADGGLHKNWGSKGASLGDRKAGGDVILDLSWDARDVPDPTADRPDGGAVYWVFLLVNAGHANDDVVAVLNKAADDFAGALAGKVIDPGDAGMVGSLAYLAGLGILLAAQEVLNLLTANCDGQVGSGTAQFPKTAAELSQILSGRGRTWAFDEPNPGTDSAHGCGSNSDYLITYNVHSRPASRSASEDVPRLLGHQGDDQLDAVFVARDGSVQLMWVGPDLKWQGPVALTGERVAPAGAPVALAHQGEQLDAVFVAADGSVQAMWVGPDLKWQGPVSLTGHGAAPAGAPVAVADQGGQLDALFVGTDGAMQVLWVGADLKWQGPVALTGAGVASAGAPIALAHQGDDQLDAVFVARDGSVQVMWVGADLKWQGPVALTGAGLAIQ